MEWLLESRTREIDGRVHFARKSDFARKIASARYVSRREPEEYITA